MITPSSLLVSQNGDTRVCAIETSEALGRPAARRVGSVDDHDVAGASGPNLQRSRPRYEHAARRCIDSITQPWTSAIRETPFGSLSVPLLRRSARDGVAAAILSARS